MSNSVAIVGMGCRYPDARSPVELWENTLAGRRAFRRLPPERLRLEDYLSADRRALDSVYSSEAALIEDYEFDRVRFRVAGSTYRSADPAHWLALDVASQTLSDAGFVEGGGLPRETTGVFLGNTLTGEFSRANVLRLRWPYVRRVIEASLASGNWPRGERREFLETLEVTYKEPFPPVGEESLAGSLSNTIAGRICNHFNFQGGGYTVDGACASSLLAVANACSALVTRDLDAALAGGVDLSVDPFELVGFAKAGALASEMMRVYDARSDGFWPGEGCGFVLLMRREDALEKNLRIYAVIEGWGISSDGSGGITRPEVEGQLLALRRAYRRAGFGIETVAYFEGHGTGTSVGDATELQALSIARREASAAAPPAAIGSIKANIGHTKAAAGVAGLIKATQALNAGIIPPNTGCDEPHAQLSGESPALRVLKAGEPWPADQHLRAGVSSMGFGGINAHVVLAASENHARRAIGFSQRALLSSSQDAELFLLGGQDADELQRQVDSLLAFAAKLSRAELSDLAAQLERTLSGSAVRAAVVASSPSGLAAGLEKLRAAVARGQVKIDARAGVFFGGGTMRPRIGFLFPGQGSPSHVDGGALRRRFEAAQELYAQVQSNKAVDETATEIAQPAIVTASVACLRVLSGLGIQARVAVGHSLGELTSLHWAGALDEKSLLSIAGARGKAMGETAGPAGAMASIAAGRLEVEELLNGERVVIAGLNSPFQTVLSGEADGIAAVMARARSKNLSAVKLPVSHAFHSPLVAAAAPVLAAHLSGEKFEPLRRAVVSTVTGDLLGSDANLPELLCRQVTSPVRFMEAVRRAEIEGVDLWLEVGPGQVLGGLVGRTTETPVVSLDAGGPSLKGLLCAAGAAFALGQPVRHEALFAGRFTRAFNLDWRRKFFVNPCELAPVSETVPPPETQPEKTEQRLTGNAPVDSSSASALALITQMVAERAELPPSAIECDSRLLGDLHLNSITVSQIVAEAARRLGLPRPTSPTDFADATVAEIAQWLDEQLRFGHTASSGAIALSPPGVDSWIRPFSVEYVERPRPKRQPSEGAGDWEVLSLPGHPLADSLRRRLNERQAGGGVVVCLPPEPDETVVRVLLAGAKTALGKKEGARFVLVQHGGGAAAFARTLHLEAPHVTTCVVDVPQAHPQAVEWIVAEILAAEGYVEAHYDFAGRRREMVVRPLSIAGASGELPLTADDVLVVTGGGKGITAECALSLAKESGARLGLIGRAQPERDPDLKSNLERMAAAGLNFRYVTADMMDESAVRAAVKKIEGELGAVTGILHGAASNVPQLIRDLDEEAFRRTVAVKVQGARHLLAAVNPEKLRLLVTFGSIIARTGLPGEADYGLANEWLTRLTEQWKTAHPGCRCLAVEWSIWSDIGMGARMGRADALAREGITPIPPDQGVAVLRRLLGQSLPAVSVIVMGRFGELPTFKIERPELPFLRFLEQPRVYYPNVELVVDVDLSTDTDPYLNDHQLQGERLLPAVLGLEAMAQAAMALAKSAKPPAFEKVSFNRPVVIPGSKVLKVRVAALVREPGFVEVVLRCEETDFQIDHFHATCRFESAEREDSESLQPLASGRQPIGHVSLDPARDLYGGVLFHRGRFQRLGGYRLLKATECLAEISPDGATAWFSRYLPGDLVLGDPGARDAAIHAVQACIPHATLVPVKVERLTFGLTKPSEPLLVHARERSRNGNAFIYDLRVAGADGRVYEYWEGLEFRTIGDTLLRDSWIEPLLAPYLERRVQELNPGIPLSVAMVRDGYVDRRTRSDQAIRMALGEEVAILRRPDGKPLVEGAREVSAAHTNDLTLAVAGPAPLSCDVEQVVARPASVWVSLLGEHRYALACLVARSACEDEEISATRVWSAAECLKKAGAMADAPLTFSSSTDDGWALFSCGRFTVATYTGLLRLDDSRVVIAVLTGKA
ncbi:MAG TPA: type I polyketide synthase [Pyrinomonadaceae bacterium]|nr:type I polyketide synthase [Pyrinomonadaceae bacterium]